jgi:hypothetical protein
MAADPAIDLTVCDIESKTRLYDSLRPGLGAAGASLSPGEDAHQSA